MIYSFRDSTSKKGPSADDGDSVPMAGLTVTTGLVATAAGLPASARLGVVG